ncbi:hypothetical protein HOA55_01670 [archaeon]|jgi:hypothetical protein|nr:hypothetical protein [archaeon]MBT3577690.1 hypothetical protein [archaeon]MBT6820043.1 hypothetical protein [archaeon]MBT6956336.1 hypothetical protein [archaeon]MBT7025356.1 hypothetical protein [archaeon]
MEKKGIVRIKAEYLGAVKQLPPFIRELKAVLPEAIIDIETGDHTIASKHTARTLRNDLALEGIRASRIHINGRKNKKPDAHVSFEYHPGMAGYSPATGFHFFIDPLKFEPRRLLTGGEIAKIRDEYFLGSKKVVLGGSIQDDELKDFVAQSERILSQDRNTKIMIVPRCPNDAIETLKDLGVGCAFDRSSAGRDTNYTLITEVGVLDRLYSACDVAVMGDTFSWNGWGQNPLEPALYGKRIVTGPNSRLNRTAYEGLEESGLLQSVEVENIAYAVLMDDSPEGLATSQKKAAEFIKSKQGAAKAYAGLVAGVVRGEYPTERHSELVSKIAAYDSGNFGEWGY